MLEGTPYYELFSSTNDSPLFNGIVTAGLGTMAWTFRARNDRYGAYAAVSFALFVASAAMLTMVIGPFNWIVTAADDSAKQAFQDKLAQFLAVVPTVLVLMWMARRSRESIYLVRGKVARWLPIGVAAVLLGAVAITLIATSEGNSFDALVDIAPWVVGFAALNAFMEELWFRSVFLTPYTEHMGPAVAVAVTAFVFGGSHFEATYMSDADQIPFALLVIGLGVVLAMLMRWGQSIWGAVLFHIGMGLVIALEFIEVN